MQGIDLNPLTSSIAQVQASLQTQIDQISRQVHDLPAPFDPSTLEQRLTALERKNHSIFSSDVSSLVSVVKRLQSDKALIEEVTERITCQLDALAHEFSARPETEVVAQLTNQLEALAQRLDNLPTPPEPVDLSGIQAKIKDLNTQLCDLSEQFSARPEMSGVEELKTEVEQLVQKFQMTSRLAEEIEELKQGQRELGQIRSLQQQLKDLVVSTAQEHDYTQKLSEEFSQRIDQLNQVTAKLDERTQRLGETPRHLEEIKQLSVGLDERTAALYERTRNLAQMEQELEIVQHLTANLDERTRYLRGRNLNEIQQQMANLRQLVNESAKTTDLERAQARLSAKIAGRVDTAIETQILPLSAQLSALSQQFNTRTEPQAIKQLERMQAEQKQRLESMADALAPVDLSEVDASITKINQALTASATKQELDALTQRSTSVIEQLKSAIADLPRPPQPFDPSPLHTQIENLSERIDSLPLTVLQQQLKEAHELIEGLDASAKAIHDRTRNLAQMEQQLEIVQQLTASLNERTGHLLNRTHNQRFRGHVRRAERGIFRPS